MKIPNSTISASQFRTYGTGGITLEEHEAEQGCPRKYHAKYVEGLKEPPTDSYALIYGRLFHETMFLIEQEDLTPEEALEKAFEPIMPPEMWTEARSDLENYFSRGSTPSDRFGTLTVEEDLKALLYEDEDFGPIYYRGILDLIAVDLETPDVVHLVDYKTNRQPAKYDDLLGDIQLRGYHWLVKKNWSKWVAREPRIVSHLDVVKFRDVEIAYSEADIEDWHSWAVAVTRKILRDETAEPILNPGCGYCYVRDTCPAFNALPALAETLQEEGSALADPLEKLKWRDRAHDIKKLLEKGVAQIDSEFKQEAALKGRLVVGDQMWVKEPQFSNLVDIKRLHALVGDEAFYRLVSTSKTAIERFVKGKDAGEREEILSVIAREMTGTTVTRRQAGGLK